MDFYGIELGFFQRVRIGEIWSDFRGFDYVLCTNVCT